MTSKLYFIEISLLTLNEYIAYHSRLYAKFVFLKIVNYTPFVHFYLVHNLAKFCKGRAEGNIKSIITPSFSLRDFKVFNRITRELLKLASLIDILPSMEQASILKESRRNNCLT